LLQAGQTNIETEFVLCETWSMKAEHEVKLDRTEENICVNVCIFTARQKE